MQLSWNSFSSGNSMGFACFRKIDYQTVWLCALLQHSLGFAKELVSRLYPINITIGTELN